MYGHLWTLKNPTTIRVRNQLSLWIANFHNALGAKGELEMNAPSDESTVDLFIIGGGVNGCGIARDAAGRGLSVTLAEMGDLAQATSSASSKLFHGGLRYLEYFEFGLVRHALAEREVLMRAMPHISWPMRFVLPYHRDMRYDATTPTAKVLSLAFPWMKGRRPAWLIRLGLFMYDHLGGRKTLPSTRSIDLGNHPTGQSLQSKFERAYEYSDCWVQDARLVVLNAVDAAGRGARILTRTKVVSATRGSDLWQIETRDQRSGETTVHNARRLVNAAGPWVAEVVSGALKVPTNESVRLVRGSHIVVPKIFDHDQPYILQGSDGRIVFAIPYEGDFTLIGTTDVDHHGDPQSPKITEDEIDYLCSFASDYFQQPVQPDNVVWSYSGVRPLYDDGASSAQSATRDYVLSLDTKAAPLLNVFGGKITTYRVLAEDALAKLGIGGAWTAGVALPGGYFPWNGGEELHRKLMENYTFLSKEWAGRLVYTYGTKAFDLMASAESETDLGVGFGATLTASEVNWLIDHEFAQTAEDVVWRRTKLGLRLSEAQIQSIEEWMNAQQGRVQ